MDERSPAALEDQVKLLELINHLLSTRVQPSYFGILGRESSQISPQMLRDLKFKAFGHEASAGFAAAACGRISGQIGCLFTTLGPGVTNSVTPVANAYLDKTPMVLVCTQAESNDLFYNSAHQCIDNIALLEDFSRAHFEFHRVDNASIDAMAQALLKLFDGPPGPVVISIPVDLLSSDCETQWVDSACSILAKDADQPNMPSEEVIHERIDLGRFSAPIAFIGDATARAKQGKQIHDLLVQKQVPILTSYNAKGFIDENHKLSYGVASPYVDSVRGSAYYSSIFSECDCILLFDTDYSEDIRTSIWDYGSKKVVILACAGEPGYPSEISKGWKITSLQNIQESLHDAQQFTKRPTKGLRIDRQAISEAFRPPSDRLGNVALLFEALSSLSHLDVFVDVGLHRAISGVLLSIGKHGRFTTSVGLSSFGFAIPSAFGASLSNAAPGHVVAICGDAGFSSALVDFGIATRHNLGITVIVVNDGRHSLIDLYGSVGLGEDLTPFTACASSSPSTVARALGWDSTVTTSPKEIAQILTHRQQEGSIAPYLVEFPTFYPISSIANGVSGSFREFVHE